MLIFEIPKLFHFQRTALQTGICLPFLPFQPSRLDWHRLGGDQEAEMLCLCQPGLPTQSSGLCTRSCHLQDLWSCPQQWEHGRDLGLFLFSSIPRGHTLQAVRRCCVWRCSIFCLGEGRGGGIPKGKPRAVVGLEFMTA